MLTFDPVRLFLIVLGLVIGALTITAPITATEPLIWAIRGLTALFLFLLLAGRRHWRQDNS